MISLIFRQTLPIIKHGTREQSVFACLKQSHLWKCFAVKSLTLNMRVGDHPERKTWDDHLKLVGDGSPSLIHEEPDMIHPFDQCCCVIPHNKATIDSITECVKSVFIFSYLLFVRFCC